MKIQSNLGKHGQQWTRGLLTVMLAALIWSPATLAQHHGNRPGAGHGQGHFPGHVHGQRGVHPHWNGEIGRFHEHDWNIWRGGHWSHARHNGHFGWWWVIGDAWYFYPSPVYPYPNPWEPSLTVINPPLESTPPPTQYWYYCDASSAYYPYVPTCPGGWKQVPATPRTSAPAQPN